MIGAFLAASTAAAGWPIGVPSSPANASCCCVIEVVLAAEEDHLVGQQRLADLLDRGRVEVAAEAHPVDSGADAAAQLGDGYLVCHCCRPLSDLKRSGVVN